MATAVRTADGVYELDKPHSTVQFSLRHVGVSTFRASFADIDGQLVIESGNAELWASASAESVSIVDPPEFREHVVRGDDFFAADAHPQLTFRSTSIEFSEDGAATVTGELAIRGVFGSISATGTFFPPTEDPFGGTRAGLELSATIDRRTWGMTWQTPLPNGGDALGWEVDVTAHLELTRRP